MTKIVQVAFTQQNSHALYAYYTDFDLELEDLVVVDSPNSGYTIVTVKNIEESAESVMKATKWIVDKIDTSGYNARCAAERQRALLIAKIKKAEEAARKVLDLERLAELSPELKDLTAQLKALG